MPALSKPAPTRPAMDHSGGWKDSQFSWELGEVILERLGAGETIGAVCADPDMPSMATLHRWRHVQADFGEAYAQLRAGLVKARRRAARAKFAGRRTRAWISGRRSTYDEGWVLAFCLAVAEGEPVYRICARPEMPSVKAVYRWLRMRPEFAALYAAAKREAILDLEIAIEKAVDLAVSGPMSAEVFRDVRREVARLEGRIGRLTPKTWR